ncbi:MAG: recombinase family protein [Chloroflexi bacterium]|nr:recombinase family protein [Chloroflexota bacterium]
MTRLPRTVDDLRGLRCARWIRESTGRQAEKNGPEAQREQQDWAIERYGLVDTGIVWSVAHTGRTIARTDQWAAMMASAGQDWDVLVVGYVSRFARNLRDAVNARHDIHGAGASILFADDRLLTSDEDAWEQWARETVEAEAYSRRLGRRVTEAYGAKFRRHKDPGGNAPLGFVRDDDGFLMPDPSSIGRAVAVFERYGEGTVSLVGLEAETGIDREALKVMIRNPIYNGWVRRHRRQPDEQVLPAAWRDDPPVSDALWARVQEVRAERYHGGGRPTPRHIHMLAGLLVCRCGARIRATTDVKRTPYRRRYQHERVCDQWDGPRTRLAALYEGQISDQVEGIRTDAWVVANIRRLAGTRPPRPDSTSLRRRQVERDLEDLARRHARRAIDTAAYLAEHQRLTVLLDSIVDVPSDAPVVDPDVAVAYLRDMRRLWRDMDDAGRRALAPRIYERITVEPSGVVSVQPTAEAMRHGLVFALPEWVPVARPEGLEPPTL